MGLKTRTIPNFVTEQGFKDDGTVCSIKAVHFDYQNLRVVIEWEFTPSSWVEGMPKQTKAQVLAINPKDTAIMTLVVSVSDKLQELAGAIPFIPTPDGAKSFDDLQSVTTDVGTKK